MSDPYKTLQVDPEADAEVVEAAYRRLARKYHPDVNTSPEAAERMKAINAAYQLLHDPVRRGEYDRQRKASAETAEQGHGEHRAPSEASPAANGRGCGPLSEQPGPDEAGWEAYEPACWWHGYLARDAVCIDCRAGLCGWCARLFNPARCLYCARRAGTEAWNLLAPPIVYAAATAVFALFWLRVLPNGSAPWYQSLLAGAFLGVGLAGYIDFGLLALRWLASYGDLRLVVLAVLALVAGLILVPFAGIGGVVMAIVRTTRSLLAFRRARRTGAAAETYLRGAA